MTNKVKFLLSNNQISKTFIDLVEKAERIYISAAWVTHSHEAYKALFMNKHKVKRFFCGIERNLTSPKVIEDFLGDDVFRIIDDPELFHHKAYIFSYKDKKGITRWETLVGSANFTVSGFNKNHEIIQHTVFDEIIDIAEKLDKQFLEFSIMPDKEFLKKYELDHKESKKKNENEKRKRKHQRSSYYRLSWSDFFSRIQNDEFHSLKGRLDLLDKVQLLLSNNSFEEIHVDDRKRIAGTFMGEDSEIEGFDTRWFGGMSGAGYFSQNVIENPKSFAKAMSKIPKEGRVTEANYDEFMEVMIPASGYEGDPLSVCTRILAMIRPDYFFCVTSANREGLAKDLNFAKTTLSIKNYWERVVEPLIESEWWQEQNIESELERKAWKYRVALLDVLYYIPKG